MMAASFYFTPVVRDERSSISSDLEMIYSKTESASSTLDFSTIIDFCRNVSGDSTRNQEDRNYAKILMSWALNRRGESRSDQASLLVQNQQWGEATKLDAQARKDFEAAIQLDKSRWRAYFNLGVTDAIQGKNDLAIEHFSEAIRLKADYSDAYFNRGEVYFKTNQLDLALADYEHVVDLSPQDSAAFSARAHTQFAMGKSQEALTDYRKAMELAPQSADVAAEYADTCQALGKWKDAAVAYQHAMQLDGNHARTLQNAAWMMATCPDDFYRNGRTALQTAERAIQFASAPNSPQVLDVLAAAQAAAGDFSKAQSTLVEALRSTTDPVLRSEMQMRGRMYHRKVAYVQPKR
jgi:tetratricopeptide (TPR) repeat protein